MNAVETAISKGQFVLNAAYILIAVAAYLVARMMLQEQESRAAAENLEELKNRRASNPLVRLLRPIFTQYFVPILRGKTFWDERRKIFRRKLIAAGLRDELTPDEFIAFKISLIVFFPLVGGFLKAADFIDIGWIWILASGALGWFYPNYWVKTRADARQKLILRSLPFVVDLLALSTEAGLDFVGAMGKVVEKATPSPLVDEFSQLLKEIRVGSSRTEAMREMAARIDMPQVNSFVAILIAAEAQGGPIGKVLRQQGEQIRSERMLRAEKAGARAQQAILFPVIFFIVPAVMLMVFGPVVLGFINGGG